MPRVIEELSKRSGRPSVYPWDDILGAGNTLAYDRDPHASDEDIRQGLADYACEDQSFMNAVRTEAGKRDLKVSLRNPRRGVVEVEVLGPEDEVEDSTGESEDAAA